MIKDTNTLGNGKNVSFSLEILLQPEMTDNYLPLSIRNQVNLFALIMNFRNIQSHLLTWLKSSCLKYLKYIYLFELIFTQGACGISYDEINQKCCIL